MAGRMFGIEVRVYMVRVSYEQGPFRRSMMETWGAEVIASPSTKTNSGRNVPARDADSPGWLGIAISEAVEEAAGRKDTNYTLGSVLNHVLLHQTVIGLEAKKRNRALKLSMCAFWIGFPGSMNCSRTPCS
jgi:predicted alternative tryptophan synthase beta-subunit